MAIRAFEKLPSAHRVCPGETQLRKDLKSPYALTWTGLQAPCKLEVKAKAEWNQPG